MLGVFYRLTVEILIRKSKSRFNNGFDMLAVLVAGNFIETDIPNGGVVKTRCVMQLWKCFEILAFHICRLNLTIKVTLLIVNSGLAFVQVHHVSVIVL